MREVITNILQKMLPPDFAGEVFVSAPDVGNHGDYSTNVAFALAKKLGKSPREAAEEIVQRITDYELRSTKKIFSRVEGAGGVFINFWIAESVLLLGLGDSLKRRAFKPRRAKKMRIEYFQPNVAKIL